MKTRCFGCMAEKENSPVCEHCGYDERSKNNVHQLPAGTVVGGQYTLGRVLGQGGFGITYMAWDNVMQQRVAVKEYFPSGYAGRDTHSLLVTSYDSGSSHDFESNKQRFLREAESLGKLWSVSQIVKVLRHFEDNGTAYIAMEYVEGQDLRKHMKQLGRPMSVEETLAVMIPVMEALEQVHRAELVHRDISPDNIMLLPDGSAKLLDFGAARYVENADAEKDRDTSTQSILKHGFAPPEQYSSHGALGPWTDVYAMCATMYYCMTGRVPPEAMNRSVEGEPIDWNRIPGLSDRQKAALEKGMTLQPGKRFAAMSQLREELLPKNAEKSTEQKKTGKNAGTASEKPVVVDGYDQKPKKKKWMYVAAAAALTAAVGAALIFPKNPQPSNQAAMEAPDTTAAAQTLPTVPIKSEPLEIASSLEMSGVEYNSKETIPVLSEHSAKELTWTSGDPRVAIVSEIGVVYAKGYGTTEITAEYNGQTAVCRLTVDLLPNVTCKYTENETGVTITGYKGNISRRIVLPRVIDNMQVTAIGEAAFKECSEITVVSIPESVTSIGSEAFYGCKSLLEIHIPENVLLIGDYAFFNCNSLNNITIPEGVTYIGRGALRYCSSLTEIQIPDTVTYIGRDAFSCCERLTDISIPEGVPSISASVFEGCTGLVRVSIPDSVTIIEQEAFKGCKSLNAVAIPKNVTEIGVEAFAQCTSLTDVVIPESVMIIGKNAFQTCSSLTEVIIPGGVKNISVGAFQFCTKLSRVTLSEGVSSVESYAFAECGALTDLVIAKSVTSIETGAFEKCTSLSSITLPEGMTAIEQYAFRGCTGLTEVIIPDGVTTIGKNAFEKCSALNSVIIPRSVNHIESQAFSGTGLTDVTVSESCEVSKNAFPGSCLIRYYADADNSSGGSLYTVTAENLAVYSAPSTGAPKVATRNKGDQVTVTMIQTLSGEKWGYTGEGWILMKYVE